MPSKEFVIRVAQCLAKLKLAYGRLACSAPAALVWAEALEGIQIEHIESACREYLKTEKSTPTPAAIRTMALANSKDAEMAAKAVRIRGVTYFTNPPDLERQKAIYDANRRYLEKLAASKPAPTPKQEPIQETPEQFEARRQQAIERLKKIQLDRQQREAANEGQG